MSRKSVTRRGFLKVLAITGAGMAAALAGCQPQVVEKVVKETVEVIKEVPKEVVKEKEVTKEVIKEVTKEVVKKETVVVEKEVKVFESDFPFKYVQMGKPFGGKPIKLSYWQYSEVEEAFWRKWLDGYSQANPNVTFEITNVPYTQMWTKLKVAIPAGEAPDFFYVHQDGAHWDIVMGGLMLPFPEEIFPPEVMRKTFVALDSWSGPEGKIYWIPVGAMQGCLYYNNDMLNKAGIKVEQLNTWDGIINAAKEMTKRDNAGRVTEAGLDVNGFWDWNPMFYNQGYFLWPKDYRYQCYAQEAVIKSIQFLWDVNHKHKVCDDDFLNWQDGFAAGKVGMNTAWNWFSQWMKLNHPQVNLGVKPTGNWNGTMSPATTMGSPDPQSPGVPKSTPKDRAEVCFDVIAWLNTRVDYLIDLSINKLTPPAIPSLAKHPLLLSNPMLAPLLPAAEWAVMGRGGAPLAGSEFGKYAGEEAIRQNGGKVAEGCNQGFEAARKATLDYKKDVGAEFYVFEHKYTHADLMKYPDC